MNTDQEKIHKCDHIIRKDRKGRKVRCQRNGAHPMITRSLHDRPRYPQPRWLCSIHWPKHKEVRFDGMEIEQRQFPGIITHTLRAVS